MKIQNFKTYTHKPQSSDSQWYLVDASQMTLGRLATVVARLLIGKHKASYTPHLGNGDKVIVINSDQVVLTGNKEQAKIYYRHSGYTGNLKQRTVAQQRALDSRVIIEKAVKGMLPKNKLQAVRLKNLKIYKDDQHLHSGQQPQIYDIKKQQVKS